MFLFFFKLSVKGQRTLAAVASARFLRSSARWVLLFSEHRDMHGGGRGRGGDKEQRHPLVERVKVKTGRLSAE